MHHKKEALIALLASKGWSQSLIDATFELVGGFDVIAEHTNTAWFMMFANSLGNQIEIDEDDGSDLLPATKIFSDIEKLSDKNMPALDAYLVIHSDDILRALRTQFDEPAKRLTAISDLMWPEEADEYISSGQLKEKHKIEVVNIMVYYACYWLTHLSGGFNTDRLALLDLSGVTSISLVNVQAHVESKPKEKNARFIGTLEELYEICNSYYIRMFWNGKGKKRSITGLCITKKNPKLQNIPIFLNLKNLSNVITKDSCFVDLHMVSTSKNCNDEDLILLSDDTVAKIKVEGCQELELIMSQNAVLELSGDVVSGTASIEDQSRLIALDFTPKKRFNCNKAEEDSRIFCNSANFIVEQKINDNLINVANKAEEEIWDGYICYLRNQRSKE